jgi:NAD(P)-dependent dehydrogenase (short-subunit alcohol dehydrogenase family)
MEELFLTNTFIPIMVAEAALNRMAEAGVIVNISGVIAEHKLPGMATYGASKAATRSFAREARRTKMRVLDARPPHTETGLAGRPIEGDSPKMPPGLTPPACRHYHLRRNRTGRHRPIRQFVLKPCTTAIARVGHPDREYVLTILQWPTMTRTLTPSWS